MGLWGGHWTERPRGWLRRLRGKPHAPQEEAQMLRPVALAGASRRSSHTHSQLCSSFAAVHDPREPSMYQQHRESAAAAARTSLPPPPLPNRRPKAHSEGDAPWPRCQVCSRRFVRGLSRYADYCSHDCKSASLIDSASLWQHSTSMNDDELTRSWA